MKEIQENTGKVKTLENISKETENLYAEKEKK